MKTVLYFFLGLFLMAASALGLFVSGAMFDSAGDIKIEPFVFQPSDYSDFRTTAPIPLEQMPDDFVLEQLVRTFISEYFGVIPSRDEIKQHADKSHGVLGMMATTPVFNEWRQNSLPELESLAEKNNLRLVRLIPPIVQKDDYYEVNYITETYDQPNIMGAAPVVKKGIIYVKLNFKKELWDGSLWDGKTQVVWENRPDILKDTEKYLEHGGNPAAMFKFQVEEVVR